MAVDRFIPTSHFETQSLIGEEELGLLQVVTTPLIRSSHPAAESSDLWRPIRADQGGAGNRWPSQEASSLAAG